MLINIPVTPLALLCNCIDVVCRSSVLVGRVFLFGGFRCVYIYGFVWSCFDLLVYLCVCVSTVPRHIRFLLVSSFSRICLVEWGFALSSLFVLSTFVLGGGGVVV